MAAAPAARAAFLATCLTFGRSAFFVVLWLFVRFVFPVFNLVRARFNEDLAFVRLPLFFMIPASTWERPLSGLNINISGHAKLVNRPQYGVLSGSAQPFAGIFELRDRRSKTARHVRSGSHVEFNSAYCGTRSVVRLALSLARTSPSDAKAPTE
jgi:hypothetical protein